MGFSVFSVEIFTQRSQRSHRVSQSLSQSLSLGSLCFSVTSVSNSATLQLCNFSLLLNQTLGQCADQEERLADTLQV